MAITKTKSPKKYLDRNLERELIKKYQETDDNKYLEPLLIAHSAYIQKVASEQYQNKKICEVLEKLY